MNEVIPGKTTIKNYIFTKHIDGNKEGDMWIAQNKICQNKVLIRIIPKSEIVTEDSKNQLNREVSMAKSLSHPFISEFYECFDDNNFYYLVEEYVENGNLTNYINSNGRLTESQARFFFLQIILVLDYLHNEKYIAHRDLNADNILLDHNGNIRVTSFGLSNIFTNYTPELKTACGLPAYASPEMIKGNAYTKATDIWSAGIILYFIVTGSLPFEDENTQRLLRKIVYTYVHYPYFMSLPLIDLLKKLLLKDPEKRLSLDGVKEHAWFSQSEYSVLERLKSSYDTYTSEIDKDIISRVRSSGVCTHNSNGDDENSSDEAIARGECSEAAVLYRQLARQKATEMMKNLAAQLASCEPQQRQRNLLFSGTGSGAPKSSVRSPSAALTTEKSAGLLGFPSAQTQLKKEPFPGAGGGAPRATLPLQVKVAASVGGGGFGATGALVAAPRRLSRPVAVRRPMSGVHSEMVLKSQEM